jgi:hypothetical protein
MMSKSIVSVGAHLYAKLESMGFSRTSDGMVALGGLATGIGDGGTPAAGGSDAVDCDTCMHESTDCLGCCGAGCTNCMGVCTDECLAHDKCFGGPGSFSASCNLKFLKAAGSFIISMITGGPCDGIYPLPIGIGGGGGGGDDGCTDPTGCCPADYHPCCDTYLCCSDWDPPETCP